MDNENFGNFYEIDPNENTFVPKDTQLKTNFADYQAQNQTPVYEPPAPDPIYENLPNLDDFISDETFLSMQEEVTGRYEKQFIALYSFLQGLLNLSGSGLQDPKHLEDFFKIGAKISDNLTGNVRMRTMFGNMENTPIDEKNEQNTNKDFYEKVRPEDLAALENNNKQFSNAHTSQQKEDALLGLINVIPDNQSILLPTFGFAQNSFPIQAYLRECISVINEAFTNREKLNS